MPVLPTAWMIPDHSAKRWVSSARAAKVIGHISIPEQPAPSTICAASIDHGPVAIAAIAAPPAATASRQSDTRFTP